MLIRLLCLLSFIPSLAWAQDIKAVEAVIAEEMKIVLADSLPKHTPTLKDTIEDISALEALPMGLTSETDSMLSDWFMDHYIRLDSSCVSDNTPLRLNDSIYRSRLEALPTIIEMNYNPIVKRYIEMYTQKRRSLVEYMLGLGHFYFPIFEEILDREQVPMELKYLPIIESALKPTARSHMGATGLWQFMFATGKGLGLEINSLIDERCDPYKATEAAVRYLKQLYNTYGDWNLAIAAYNCGPGNVNKAIRRSGGKRTFWEVYYYLPKETRGYIPAFIAANYVMNYYCEHNLCPALHHALPATDTIMVNENIHLRQISENLKLDIEQLRLLNPQYRRDLIPAQSRPMPLTLPVMALYSFIEHQDSITNYQADRLIAGNGKQVNPGGTLSKAGTKVHRVRSGETLGHIAERHRTSVSTIKRLNGLRSDRLRIGQQLLVYDNGSSKKNSSSEQSSNSSGLHIVKSGDNLWLIARRYPGVSAQMIKEANNLRSNSLKIGQRLIIPSI